MMLFVCIRLVVIMFFFFFKQKTAYEMRISDWSSDVCSSDLIGLGLIGGSFARALRAAGEVERIVGFDPDAVQREQATALGVVDQVFDDAAAAVRDADLVVIAVPVLHTAEALRSCVGALKAGARKSVEWGESGSVSEEL